MLRSSTNRVARLPGAGPTTRLPVFCSLASRISLVCLVVVFALKVICMEVLVERGAARSTYKIEEDLPVPVGPTNRRGRW